MPDVKPVPRWLRAANRAALAMSRIGLTMGPVHVLTVPGRRTGSTAIRDAGPADNPVGIIDHQKPENSDAPPPR